MLLLKASKETDIADNFYPRPRGRRVQYFVGLLVCLFVCLCVTTKCCLNSIISTSKQATALKLGNLGQTVVLYKTGKFFQANMAHIACKCENKKTNRTDFTRKTFESS